MVPNRIKIGKNWYSIIIDREECEEANAYGLYYEDEKEIYLTNSFMGKKLTPKEKEVSFYHEITHGIFVEIGRPDLSKDEKLVDAIAYKLYQINKQLYK